MTATTGNEDDTNVFNPEFSDDDIVNWTTDVLPRVNFTVSAHSTVPHRITNYYQLLQLILLLLLLLLLLLVVVVVVVVVVVHVIYFVEIVGLVKVVVELVVVLIVVLVVVIVFVVVVEVVVLFYFYYTTTTTTTRTDVLPRVNFTVSAHHRSTSHYQLLPITTTENTTGSLIEANALTTIRQ